MKEKLIDLIISVINSPDLIHGDISNKNPSVIYNLDYYGYYGSDEYLGVTPKIKYYNTIKYYNKHKEIKDGEFKVFSDSIFFNFPDGNPSISIGFNSSVDFEKNNISLSNIIPIILGKKVISSKTTITNPHYNITCGTLVEKLTLEEGNDLNIKINDLLINKSRVRKDNEKQKDINKLNSRLEKYKKGK